MQAGTLFTITKRHAARMSITEANRIMNVEKEDIQGIEQLLAVKELAKSWRDQLESRLKKLQQVNLGG